MRKIKIIINQTIMINIINMNMKNIIIITKGKNLIKLIKVINMINIKKMFVENVQKVNTKLKKFLIIFLSNLSSLLSAFRTSIELFILLFINSFSLFEFISSFLFIKICSICCSCEAKH